MGKHQFLNQFEFYSERLSANAWLWYYRPVGAPVFTTSTVANRKALTELLADPDKAAKEYVRSLSSQANVAAAQAALDEASIFKKKSSQPDWDPGGSTNNIGKVKRELDRARNIDFEIRMKTGNLERAKELSELLRKAPFDAEAWLQTNFPS